RDALAGHDPLAELDVRRGEVVVTGLEAPVEKDADGKPAVAAPADPRHRPGAAGHHRRTVRCRDVHAGVRRGEQLRDDSVRRPADSRREDAWRLVHEEAEAWI